MKKLQRSLLAGISLAGMILVTHVIRTKVLAAAPNSKLAELEYRAGVIQDMDDVERFHYVYGYQQDKLLLSEQVDLFAERGAEVHFQHGVFLGKEGAWRLWFGAWAKMTRNSGMPVYGQLNDHFESQPVIDISPDRQTAHARFRATDYVASYPGGPSNIDKMQDVTYENTFVKEDGKWKLKIWNLCIYADGSYGRGFADMPLPGQMGNPPGAAPGQTEEAELSEAVPELSHVLFPSNPFGPDRVETSEEAGCFLAKDQTMVRSMVFPFHYPNPVTGKYVTWKNH
jgi:SnoaL-like domain